MSGVGNYTQSYYFLSIFLSIGLNAELLQKNKNNKHTSYIAGI